MWHFKRPAGMKSIRTCLMQNEFPQVTNAVEQNKADLVTFDMD